MALFQHVYSRVQLIMIELIGGAVGASSGAVVVSGCDAVGTTDVTADDVTPAAVTAAAGGAAATSAALNAALLLYTSAAHGSCCSEQCTVTDLFDNIFITALVQPQYIYRGHIVA
eukprot:13112-Heterococcus_DN1.PRE.2